MKEVEKVSIRKIVIMKLKWIGFFLKGKWKVILLKKISNKRLEKM